MTELVPFQPTRRRWTGSLAQEGKYKRNLQDKKTGGSVRAVPLKIELGHATPFAYSARWAGSEELGEQSIRGQWRRPLSRHTAGVGRGNYMQIRWTGGVCWVQWAQRGCIGVLY